jgi:DNA-3-methyladenine glycosylase
MAFSKCLYHLFALTVTNYKQIFDKHNFQLSIFNYQLIMVLPREFYTRPDVVQIARELIGKKLCSRIGGQFTSGIISETEAYAGVTDRASHAYGNRRTARTEIMYKTGGTGYIYLCYGVHSLFNVVTNREGIPHAVLIRGIIPDEGIPLMLQRTHKQNITKNFGIGPGNVTKALGIHFSLTGIDLTKKNTDSRNDAIWLEEKNYKVKNSEILITTRIGVQYSGEAAKFPYRFVLHK